ncbi:MAG: 30S ribosomal protein S4 [Deltaproteobacteria bacterium]|nr:MAG: 30S ribosomal protein S4 [Deltaproteobacteria bacterium]
MGRYRGPRLRIIRRLGCPIPGLMQTPETLKRPYAPGHYNRKNKRKKNSEYFFRLKEKQKLRYHYGLSENQLNKYVNKAFSSKTNPGLLLLLNLESRFDNVVFRSGFARSIASARQMIRHNHFLINNDRVNFPSYKTNINDSISIRPQSSIASLINENLKHNKLSLPQYISLNEESLNIKIISDPNRNDIPLVLNEQLVIEYYSGK